MTDAERREEDRKDPEKQPAPKAKMAFMQRYYHKGAYFQDQDILKRDYTAPTERDLINKEMLPSVMQARDDGSAATVGARRATDAQAHGPHRCARASAPHDRSKILVAPARPSTRTSWTKTRPRCGARPDARMAARAHVRGLARGVRASGEIHSGMRGGLKSLWSTCARCSTGKPAMRTPMTLPSRPRPSAIRRRPRPGRCLCTRARVFSVYSL